MATRQRRQITSQARQQIAASIKNGRREIVAAAKAHAARVKGEFEAEVANWSRANRPSFTTEVKVGETEIVVTVRPYARRRTSDIFRYVDLGTPPHIIRPKRAKALRFFWGGPGSYKPKTAPAGQPKRLAGGQPVDVVFTLKVKHPGTEPREISQRIQERTYDDFRREIENAFRRIQRRK
jgi:hypothetical protein